MSFLTWLRPNERTICICHDVERGLGHLVEDPPFAVVAEELAPDALQQMLAIEKEMGISATYSVVGSFLPEVRDQIRADGHCLAFHSYDHGPGLDQLERCRAVDATIKGYRPAQSIITAELNVENLRNFGFEWLASSVVSLGFKEPKLENGFVKIPIAFDDFPLYKQKLPYQHWEQNSLSRIKKNTFAAFSLHDCYASFWLPNYRSFLKKVSALGKLKTLQIVADAITKNR